MALGPDGKQLARSSQGTSVEVIEPESGKVLKLFAAAGVVHWLRFSDNGKVLAVYTSDAKDQSRNLRTTVYDTATWKASGFVAHELHYDRNGISLSPNGRLLAHASGLPRDMNGRFQVFNLVGQQELLSFDGLTVYETNLIFARDGKQLLVNNSPPELIDLQKRVRRKLPKPPGNVLSLAINPGGTLVGYGGITGELAVGDLKTDKLLWTGRVGVQSVSALAFVGDDKYLIASSADTGIRIFAAATGEKVAEVVGPSFAGANTMQISEDGKTMATHLHAPDRTVIWRLDLP